MWRRLVGLSIVIALCAVPGFTQVPGGDAGGLGALGAGGGSAQPDRLSLAVSNPNYPVTPGDTYELTFAAGGQVSTSIVTVESDRTLNLNIFGEIDTVGMTYPELKSEVETIVREAYPRSLPSFRLVSVGLFEVTVQGAIEETTRVTAWGLSRLSDVVEPLFQPYSSRRRVLVRGAGELERVYDVFRATSVGDLSQDPYVVPGESVRIPPIGALVTVRGEVNRPGTYEALPGEHLWDLVEFAGGLSPEGDTARIRLTRRSGGDTSSETYDLSEGGDGPEVQDGDRITVDTDLLGRPLVFIEGALQAEETEADPGRQTIELIEEDVQDVEAGYVRITEFYHSGDTLYDVLSPYRDRIATFADLGRTSVIRGDTGEVIEIDAAEILYGYGQAKDVAIGAYDTIFIPSRQISVLVSGPVAEPGLYLYVPGQSAEYYIRRAGGYDREVSATGEYMILDSAGNERPPGSKVRPGDRIEVERNNFVYQFNRHFPVIISGLSIVTTVISVLTLINQ